MTTVPSLVPQPTTTSLPPSIVSLQAAMERRSDGWYRPTMTETDRLWISSRCAELRAKLSSGHDAAKVGKAITILIASFPTQAMGEDMSAARAAGYRVALDGLPTWSIEAAARKWLMGDVEGSTRFAPTPPELRRLAESIVKAVEYEHNGLMQLAEAKVFPAERIPVDPARAAAILAQCGLKSMGAA